LRSGPVTAVKFASEGIVASSSTDGSTKFWDLGTGQETEKTAEEVPEGFTFPKEGGGKEQKVGRYVVAAKGQTLVIHKAPEDKAPEDKAETAADGKADSESESENENESENESESESESESGTQTPVAFFQCASEIAAFDVAGANVAVGCKDGQVLQLRAAVLLT
jgi:WD40 repeat protein